MHGYTPDWIAPCRLRYFEVLDLSELMKARANYPDMRVNSHTFNDNSVIQTFLCFIKKGLRFLKKKT